MIIDTLERWHAMLRDKDPSQLQTLLAENVIFHSPIVHTPQLGKTLATMYLETAFLVLLNDTFDYTREIVGKNSAALEFSVEIDGILVNGVDLIQWNMNGQIIDFKVMLRPLKGINLIHRKMAALLAELDSAKGL